MSTVLQGDEPKLKKLTKKQLGFAKDYLETGNGAESVRRNYNLGKKGGKQRDLTARVMAVEILTKPSVREYLESKADIVAEVIYELATESENEAIQLNASKDILDRAGYKAVDRSVSITANVEIEPTEALKKIAHGFLEYQQRGHLGSSGVVSEPVGSETSDTERSGESD